MKTRKLRVGRFVNSLKVSCGWRFRHAPTFPTQFDLLRGTVPRQKSFIGKRRWTFLRTLLNWYFRLLHYISERDFSKYLEVFVDADYASKATDRRPVFGGAIITCGRACVCWFSRTQKCVTLSTSEAEYVALGDAVKKLLFRRQVWRFMLPGRGMPCFSIFEAIRLQYNSRKTRYRTQIRSTLTFATIFGESSFTRGIFQ